MRTLLDIENFRSEINFLNNTSKKLLFVSINPDLKTNFGHFLNYEHRFREQCKLFCAEYICFANVGLTIEDNKIIPIFDKDSGYFSMSRITSRGQEKHIGTEFCNIIQYELKKLYNIQSYDEIFIFVYCGSSKLASQLCNERWDRKLVVIINAFWDFIQSENFDKYRHVSRILLQNQIKLLSMSELHQQKIFIESGLWFDFIPNPPPLFSDEESIEIIKHHIKVGTKRSNFKVLLPGLMSMGKGIGFTSSLCEFVRKNIDSDIHYTIRDRLDVLHLKESINPKIVKGNLSQDEIVELFKSADFAILPYDPNTFRVRTSGAIVDCLIFGVVPIVIANTWLSYICEKYGFGIIIENLTPEKVHDTIKNASLKLQNERQRLVGAAFRYVGDNSWNRLFKWIFSQRSASFDLQKEHEYPTNQTTLKKLYIHQDVLNLETNDAAQNGIKILKKSYQMMTSLAPQKTVREHISPNLMVIGNGPSLRRIDFKSLYNHDSLGMNLAFRHWYKIGWFPTYYICLDTVVTESQADGIFHLIQEQKNNGIKLFFLRKNLLSFFPQVKKNPSVLFFDDYFNTPYFDGIYHKVTTGSFATLFGAMLGYKQISLIGVDLKYVQKIPEAKKVGEYVLEIKDKPLKNPNYFFDDYQLKGDRFNIPDSTPDLHYQSWVMVKERLQRFGVHVLNCNPNSRLDIFDYADINEVLPC